MNHQNRFNNNKFTCMRINVHKYVDIRDERHGTI